MERNPTKTPEIKPINPIPIVPNPPEIIPNPEKIEPLPIIPGTEPMPRPEIEPVK
jgi:hypothetical protein